MSTEKARWYTGVTRYQWLVLVIASLGWVFDVFEGQIFVASMNEAMPSLLPESVRTLDDAARRGHIADYTNMTFGAFLLGGALGGVVFGMVSDRIGRKKTMSLTILAYSLFTFVSALSQTWWHMAVFRFLVALGVGGEWAIASALVAEVFPARARAWSLGIFHASSVFGTMLAIAAGVFIIGNPALANEQYPSLPWRIGFMVGVLPSLLIIWIRQSLHEPESWQQAQQTARETGQKTGGVGEIFSANLIGRTLVGVGLAAVGLATFWGVHIYGKDLMKRDAEPLVFGVKRGDEAARTSREATVREFVAQAKETLTANGKWKESGETASVEDAAVMALASNDFRTVGFDVEILPEGDAVTYEVWTKHPTPKNLDKSSIPVESLLLATNNKESVDSFQSVLAEVKKLQTALLKRWEMLGMLLVTLGGGLGLVSFGPLCERVGRRLAFFLYHVGALVSAVIVFQMIHGWQTLLVALPVFGFLTLGMHAGYAIYFPELFPTRLRATGAGFCFNVGRILAAPILFLSGWMIKEWGYTLEDAATRLSALYALGALLPLFAPETKGRDLPE